MNHNLDDWKETVSFVNDIPVLDSSPLRWYNNDGNPLSPDELISFGYWGVRPAPVPSGYNPETHKIEEVELKDCERDYDNKIIIRSYNVVPLSVVEMANIQKIKRDELLRQTDHLVYPDVWEDLTQERKTALKTYRQLLRDVPQQDGFPASIEWPDIFMINPPDLEPNPNPTFIEPLEDS